MTTPDSVVPVPPPSLARRLAIEAHAVWLATRDPRTPLAARVVGWLIAAYALSPIDLIPDFIPVLGLLDDALLIPLGIWLFERMLPEGRMEEYRAEAMEAQAGPEGMAGVAIVIALWAAMVVAGYLLVRFFWG
ncbi:MAG: YkvA family protein [Pseudomonadota bacterium]